MRQRRSLDSLAMPLVALALVIAGVLVLTIGGYLWSASGVICENNPDCVPAWWMPAVLVIAGLLVGGGVLLARRHKR